MKRRSVIKTELQNAPFSRERGEVYVLPPPLEIDDWLGRAAVLAVEELFRARGIAFKGVGLKEENQSEIPAPPAA